MSRCYPFPPPGYEKAPQPDVAQPHKEKKDRHKHKDKKKKKKKDGESNGDTHDKDSSRPSKQARTVLMNDLLQSKTDEKQNGKVRDVLPAAVPLAPSTSAAEPSLVVKGEVRDGGKGLGRGASQRTVVIPPAVIPPPEPPLYSKQEPNGKGADVKAVVSQGGVKADAKLVLVLPPESSGNELPSGSRPGSISRNQATLPSNNLDSSQRQSPKGSELVASPACEMLALKQTSSWSDVPDEDWLFGGRASLGLSQPTPKAEVERGAGGSGSGSVQVWAEAVSLPSCELYALPYVVPY